MSDDHSMLMGLDAGIRTYVETLRDGGVETYESCEGGDGHCFPEPTIRFHGDMYEGCRAFAVAMQDGLPVLSVRRFWSVIDGEMAGPKWEMVFWKKCPAEGEVTP